MNLSAVDTSEHDLASVLSGGGLRTGHVMGVTSAGEALVDCPGNLGDPYRARSIVALDLPEGLDGEPLPVLLFFDSPNSRTPIIVGVIRDTVSRPQVLQTSTPAVPRPDREITVDGRTVHVDAGQEIVLRCGASSLTLRRDGKIVLKGVEIVSRASQTNKIKGAVVKIN